VKTQTVETISAAVFVDDVQMNLEVELAFVKAIR